MRERKADVRVIEGLVARARRDMKRLVMPEGQDERILRAARRLSDERIARPIVLGGAAELAAAAARTGVSLEGIDTADPDASPRLAAYAELYSAGRPGAGARLAQRIVRKPLFHAGMMVKAGDAEAMLAGAVNPTARVIEAGLMTVGLADGMRQDLSLLGLRGERRTRRRDARRHRDRLGGELQGAPARGTARGLVVVFH
jgi:phosphate acetyltransferase